MTETFITAVPTTSLLLCLNAAKESGRAFHNSDQRRYLSTLT